MGHMIQKFKSEIWSWEAWESPEHLDDSVFWQMNAKIQTDCTNQSETHNWQVGWGKGGQSVAQIKFTLGPEAQVRTLNS